MYNEMVLLKLVQSMSKMLTNPPEPFREEIIKHLRLHAAALCRRLIAWAALTGDEGGIASGQEGATPGQEGTTPGQEGATPGQGGATPGQGGAIPGQEGAVPPPDFPLVPASRGFRLSLRSSMESFRNVLARNDIDLPPTAL